MTAGETRHPPSHAMTAGQLPCLAGCRVLVVDDNPDVADVTGQFLALFGCEVRVCYAGPDALTVAAGFRPHVAVLDLNMPGMSGDELAERLRAAVCGQPVALLAVTAASGEDARRRIARAGFDRHLTKPVPSDELLSALLSAAAGIRGSDC